MQPAEPAFSTIWRKYNRLLRRVILLHLVIAAASPFLSLGLLSAAKVVVHDTLTLSEMMSDVMVYYNCSSAVVAEGKLPYRDYDFEYPPLSALIVVIPRLVTSSRVGYAVLFALQMWLANLWIVLLFVRAAHVRGGTVAVSCGVMWYTLFLLLLDTTAFNRLDLAPTALAFAAALAWAAGRSTPGALAAAAGALVKVFPALIAAPAVLHDLARHPRRLRGALLFSTTLAAGVLLWFGAGGTGAARSLRYHSERGLHIESTYAGPLILAARAAGSPADTVFDHLSTQLRAPGADICAAAAPIVQLIVILAVLARYRRGGCREPLRFCTAAITAFVLAGKVFSPQYLLWLMPFVSFLSGPAGRRARWLFLAACVVTTALYPCGYVQLVHLEWPAVVLLNVRTLLFLAFFWTVSFSGTDKDAGGQRDAPVATEPAARHAGQAAIQITQVRH